jgi:hypothetical protein
MNIIQKKKLCVRGSERLKNFLLEKNIQDGNIGDNQELYYYYFSGKLGVSDNKPSRHREISITKFIRLYEMNNS